MPCSSNLPTRRQSDGFCLFTVPPTCGLAARVCRIRLGDLPARSAGRADGWGSGAAAGTGLWRGQRRRCGGRSEEHTSELQSHHDLVCRLLLEKKKKKTNKKKKTKKNKRKQPYN